MGNHRGQRRQCLRHRTRQQCGGQAGGRGHHLHRVTLHRPQHPLSVAVDKKGNVYVADRGNGRVLKLAQGS
ncbi:hypothetical protein [Mycobacterium ulcerans]|uniref:hypothetical protein n=1 Tax=Mycobacterium ulcerans TaxID=1809 RepID=UPI00331445C2